MPMITVTRLNGEEYYVNPRGIEFIELTPETMLTMTAGNKVVIKETPEELNEKVKRLKKEAFLEGPKRK
jgi:flagellar protein FlbD